MKTYYSNQIERIWSKTTNITTRILIIKNMNVKTSVILLKKITVKTFNNEVVR